MTPTDDPVLAATPTPAAAPPASTRDAVPADPRRWKALAVLALVQFMLILDVTVVNVALPNIQKDLKFGPTGLAWVVDGYVLMAGGLLLLGGRLSDLVGRKRLFLIGVAVFGVASVTCGLAQNSAMLVTSRFIQGVGEALAAPAALGLVALLFPDPRERTKALGIWGGIAGLGGTLGTVISGGIVNVSPGSWRWIFLIYAAPLRNGIVPIIPVATINLTCLDTKTKIMCDSRRDQYLAVQQAVQSFKLA
jgi:MFS family permease